jgi:transcription elongation GreA/GreB family factor
MTVYGSLLDRVDGFTPLLGPNERPLAERVVAIARELAERERNGDALLPGERDQEIKRELARLTEQLGRRASQALPAATLGRAALADLYGDQTTFRSVSADCEAKLAMLGH